MQEQLWGASALLLTDCFVLVLLGQGQHVIGGVRVLLLLGQLLQDFAAGQCSCHAVLALAQKRIRKAWAIYLSGPRSLDKPSPAPTGRKEGKKEGIPNGSALRGDSLP